MKALKLKKEKKDTLEVIDGKAGADTIRLWEFYRDQARLWKLLTILQAPTTFLAMVSALVMFFFADTVIDVPEKPQPGQYSVKQLPDSEFIRAATDIVNLIASYQRTTAREQFRTARKYLWEPALTQFERTMMGEEIAMIERTGRSQMFFIDTKQIKVERHPELDKVIVRLPGTRQKLIGNTPTPPDELVYYVKMTTIPRNIHNEYGIVIVDLRVRAVPLSVIEAEDKQEAREKAREEAEERRARKRR